jgi:putative oxidoreductase
MNGEPAATRLIFPALAPLYARLGEPMHLLLRLACGLLLVPLGWGKLTQAARFAQEVAEFHHLGIEPAVPFAWFIALLECFGGLALALGLLTRPVALAIAIEMAVITFHVNIPEGRPYQLALLWGVAALVIAWRGGGKYSLDRVIGREF